MTAQSYAKVVVDSMFTSRSKWITVPDYGNLLGWHQHRFDVEVELGYQSFS